MPPLTRDRVTAASRIMLPTYPILFLAAGVLLLVQAPARTSTDVYDLGRVIAPMWLWGVAFAVIGAAEVYALLASRRRLYVCALIPGAGVAGFWAVLLFGSAAMHANASFTAGLWVAGMTVAQAATARSLAVAEVAR